MKIALMKDTQKIIGPNTWAKNLNSSLNELGINSKIVNTSNKNILKNIKWTISADVIHFFVPSPQTIFYFLICKLYKKPTIYTLHGYFNIESKKKKIYKRIPWNIINKIFLKYSDYVTTPSKDLKNHIKKLLKTKREIIVIPNGIKIEKTIEKTIEKNGKLLFVTNFDHYDKCKGILLVSNAYEDLSKNNKNLKLYVAGGGKYLNYFKKEIKNPNIQFKGYVKELKNLMKKSDMIIYISFLDNLPITLLEAISLGKYIIVNDVGGVKEILGDDLNFLLTPPTPLAIKNKITNFYTLSKTEENKITKKIKKRATFFDSKKIANKFLEVYRNGK
jgi:glycosyltransferase involved in cell wall biosynthesis